MSLESIETTLDSPTPALDWWSRIYPAAEDNRRKVFVSQLTKRDAEEGVINGSVNVDIAELIGLDDVDEPNKDFAALTAKFLSLISTPLFAPLVDDGIAPNPSVPADFTNLDRAISGLPRLDRNAVLVLVIDDLIAPLNRRFLNSTRDETRFLYLWQQDRRVAAGGPIPGPPPVPIGQEYFHSDLNAALKAAPSEQQAYRDLKLIEDGRTRLQRGDSHGAAVANIVAGAEPGSKLQFVEDDGAITEGRSADDLHFLGVNLHHAVVHDASGTFMQALASAAVLHLIKIVGVLEKKAGRRLPVVLNFSFGLTSGAPSEKRPLPLLMELFAQIRKSFGAETYMLQPAGNHRQSRLLGRLERVGPREAKNFDLRATPVSGSSVQFQVETESPKVGKLDLKLTTPDGKHAISAPARVGYLGLLRDSKNRPVAAIYRTDEGFYCTIAPTREDASAFFHAAPAGYWRVDLTATDVVETVRVQLRRGDTPGRRRLAGQMSALCDPTYFPFDPGGGFGDGDGEFIKRLGTINSLVGPPSGYVVGSLSSLRHKKTSAYSGRPASPGATGTFAEIMVDAYRSLPGIKTTGTYSNVTERLGGTSAASARQARYFLARL